MRDATDWAPLRDDFESDRLTRDPGCVRRDEVVADADGVRYVDVHHHSGAT